MAVRSHHDNEGIHGSKVGGIGGTMAHYTKVCRECANMSFWCSDNRSERLEFRPRKVLEQGIARKLITGSGKCWEWSGAKERLFRPLEADVMNRRARRLTQVRVLKDVDIWVVRGSVRGKAGMPRGSAHFVYTMYTTDHTTRDFPCSYPLRLSLCGQCYRSASVSLF